MNITKVRALLETPTQFKIWLSGKPRDEVVGHVRDPSDCVILRFLREQGYSLCSGLTSWGLKPPHGFVLHHREPYECSPRSISMPDWTFRFTMNVDEGREQAGPITAKEALKALKVKSLPNWLLTSDT